MDSGRPHETVASRPTEITALLGRGTHFEGKLFFEGRIRVDGSFRGEIRGDDVLIIGDGAQVVGEIEVSTCIVTIPRSGLERDRRTSVTSETEWISSPGNTGSTNRRDSSR